MIVWGGAPRSAQGGLYCAAAACAGPRTTSYDRPSPETGFQVNDTELWASNPVTSAASAGYWYLVRARDGCGRVGSFGDASGSVERVSAACE